MLINDGIKKYVIIEYKEFLDLSLREFNKIKSERTIILKLRERKDEITYKLQSNKSRMHSGDIITALVGYDYNRYGFYIDGDLYTIYK